MRRLLLTLALLGLCAAPAWAQPSYPGRQFDQAVTTTAAAGTGVTLTIPAVTGLFHYVGYVNIEQYAAAVLTAAATPVVCTTTNLPGSVAFSMTAKALAQGDVDRFYLNIGPGAIRASARSTNTTIVCPSTTNVIWRVTAYYFIAD